MYKWNEQKKCETILSIVDPDFFYPCIIHAIRD